MNENVKIVFGLLGGLALFLYGMNGIVASYVMGMARDLVNSTIKVARSLLGIFIVPFLSFYFFKGLVDIKRDDCRYFP